MSPKQSPPVDVPMLRFTQESFSDSSSRSTWRETLRQNIVGLEFEELNKDRYRYSSVGIAIPMRRLTRLGARRSCSPMATIICDCSF